jgi:hypothetical protein
MKHLLLIAAFLCQISYAATPTNDKIFSDFQSEYCAHGNLYMGFGKVQSNTSFARASEEVGKLKSNCTKYHSFAELNTQLQAIRTACAAPGPSRPNANDTVDIRDSMSFCLANVETWLLVQEVYFRARAQCLKKSNVSERKASTRE